MGTFEDAKELVRHAEKEFQQIRKAYEESLQAKAASHTLLIEIKNFFENLRSALDFAAHGVFERHGSSKKTNPRIFFPYATADQTRPVFEQSGRIDTCIPGLVVSRPDIVQLLLEMQHFGSRGNTWLPVFMELTNENKHQRLSPQVRKESKKLRISGGRVAMSLGHGASISIGRRASISIGGVGIPGGQSVSADPPPRVDGGKVEVITWVSFHFDSNDCPVVPLLDSALKGCRDIVNELNSK